MNADATLRFVLTGSSARRLKTAGTNLLGGRAARRVRDSFDVLVDTLVGHPLPPFRGTPTRKAVATAKLNFLDVGVAHALQGRTSLTDVGRESAPSGGSSTGSAL